MTTPPQAPPPLPMHAAQVPGAAAPRTPEMRPAPQAPRTIRAVRAVRRARLSTVPGRIRALTTAALLAIAALFAVATGYVSDAGAGLRVIGHGAGPQVVATGDLYFALSDMDAQVAGVLLIGKETGLGGGQRTALQTYEKDRATANHALVQAADLARGDAAAERTVQAVLNSLGKYEQLVGKALVLNDASAHVAGPPPPQVLLPYREATDLMRLSLLPKAYNLTLDSGTIVRRTYEDKRSSVLIGRLWVALSGLAVLAVLIGLQLYLTAGFRRIISPPLALATVGSLALIGTVTVLLSSEAAHLEKAKKDGFDSILALSRARAIGNSAAADESRYLLDPDFADTYEQVYLDKSQSILYVEGGTNLDKYYAKLDAALATYKSRPDQISFLGFYGAEARNSGSGPQSEALSGVLAGYEAFQADDQKLRRLASTSATPHSAAEIRMGQTTGSSSHDFDTYDQSLVRLIGMHQGAFDQAIKDGDGELNGWTWGLPAAALVLAGLILAGVRPRLREFR